jgi:hypothetical protein
MCTLGSHLSSSYIMVVSQTGPFPLLELEYRRFEQVPYMVSVYF